MHTRSILGAAVASATLTLVAPAAHASTVDRFDRSAFDNSPTLSSSGYEMAGATSGELDGHLSLSVRAADGTLPAQGQCESADVDAVLTVAPGESFAITTTGELCSHVVDGTPTLNAYFGAKQVTYTGAHKRARVSNGMIAFKNSWIGAQGSVGLFVRW